MSSPSLKTIIISLVIALLGFVAIHFTALSSDLSPSIAFVAGVIISALVLKFTQPSGQISSVSQESVDTKTLYVGNLPYRANEHMVKELFEGHGTVLNVRLLKDKHTGKRRGFGFVEVALNDADAMISQLNESLYQERTLKVREAKKKQGEES